MPDQLPVAEGGRPGGKGGGNNWLVIGAIAGVGTLAVLMLQNKGGATGTTAAGTSINAALGSIQEQQLNTMGLISSGNANLMNTINGNDAQLWQEISDSQNNILLRNAAESSEAQAALDYIISGPNDPRIAALKEQAKALAAQIKALIGFVPTVPH